MALTGADALYEDVALQAGQAPDSSAGSDYERPEKCKKSKQSAVEGQGVAPARSSQNADGRKDGGSDEVDCVGDRVYKQLSQREHVLARPAMYVGSMIVATRQVLVFSQTASVVRGEEISVTLSPALLKLFDEAIVNAMDAAAKVIKVTVLDNGQMSVENDGATVPVVHFEDTTEYIPTVVFSSFLSGSNFDDDEDRFTGGCHGVGIKATNTWSSEFHVTIVDNATKKIFKQRFHDNMSRLDEPVIAPLRGARSRSSTTVTWMPDYERLGMGSVLSEGLHPHLKKAIEARVFEACVCTPPEVVVSLNGTKLCLKNPAAMLSALGCSAPFAKDTVEQDGRAVWQIVVAAAPAGEVGRVAAFVNGVACPLGSHVNLAMNRILDIVMGKLRKRKGATVLDGAKRPVRAKEAVSVVLVARISKPRFREQSKETLDTPASQFGFVWEPSDAFRSAVERSDVVARIKDMVEASEERSVARQTGAARRVNTSLFKGYDAARLAGKGGEECVLIITEGESAKTLAVAGVSSLGRDKYGIYPLRGKPLNVRKSGEKKCALNRELSELSAIIGLERERTYDAAAVRKLRYQKLAIFADQDHDGSHIVGLVLSWLSTHYPSLVRYRGDGADDFLIRIVTPYIKATHPVSRVPVSFFSDVEFERWRAREAGGQVVKYKVYKGLGTSTAREAIDYFSRWDEHVIRIRHEGDACEQKLDLFFNDKCANDRKLFLSSQYDEASFVDYAQDATTIGAFLRDEMSHFSFADVKRSIPSVVDGWKPVQRKVLYTFLTKRFTKEQKVFQAAAAAAHFTAYHHGSASMSGAVVGMAQDHAGTNNIACLVPQGSFGSRMDKPSVHAQDRYIDTFLDPICESIFPPDDVCVLDMMEDEGGTVEPLHYVPVVPMVLVNGSFGIATGWMSYVPNFNPRDVSRACRAIAEGDCGVSLRLKPWYMHHDGEVEVAEDKTCRTRRDTTPPRGADGVDNGAGDGMDDGADEGMDDAADENEEMQDEAIALPCDGRSLATASPSPCKSEDKCCITFYGAADLIQERPLHASAGHAFGLKWEDVAVKEGQHVAALPLLARELRKRVDFTAQELVAFGVGGDAGIALSSGTVVISGAVRYSPCLCVCVTELPVGHWSNDYVSWVKDHFLSAQYDTSTEKTRARFAFDVDNLCTMYSVCVRIWVHRESVAALGGFDKARALLKLSEVKRTNNMYLFDARSRLRRFDTTEDILQEHARERLACYERRRLHQIAAAEEDMLHLGEKLRYTSMIRSGAIDFRLRNEAKEQILTANEFQARDGGFKYLTNMSIASLGDDAAERMEKQILDFRTKIDVLRSSTPNRMWTDELDKFDAAYAAYVEAKLEIRRQVESAAPIAPGAASKKKKRKRPVPVQKACSEIRDGERTESVEIAQSAASAVSSSDARANE